MWNKLLAETRCHASKRTTRTGAGYSLVSTYSPVDLLHIGLNMVTCRQEDNKDWCRVFSCLNILSCRPSSYWLKHKDSLLNQVQYLYSTHCYKRYLKRSSPLENCSSGNGKRPCWCRNIFSLAHTGILHSSMVEISSVMEECKITAWARDNMPLTHAGILHYSMPEMSEQGFIFYISGETIPGGCGLGV
jgi:hypothetical protein